MQTKKAEDNRYQVKRGELYWVHLGDENIGSEQNGNRPCVIIQNDTGNKYSMTTIVALITSRKKNNLPTHILVEEILYKKSTIMCEQIRTIDCRRIGEYIGFLNEEIMKEVDKSLRISLGL